MKELKKLISILLICFICFNMVLTTIVKANNEIEKEEPITKEEELIKEKTEEEAEEIIEEELDEEEKSDEQEKSNMEYEYQEEGISTLTLDNDLEEENRADNVQSIEDGYYQISTALSSTKVLDVAGASKNNGANIHIWSNVKAKQQKFKITYIGDGYYKIQNVLSQKVLDVAGGVGKNGTNVWQYESNNTNAQKWMIKDCGDGYYNIISACGNFYLDVSNAKTSNGTNIQIYEGNGTKAQKFKLIETEGIIGERTLTDGYYQISTALNSSKVLDVAGASKNEGANIHIWSNVKAKQQKFKINYIGEGYYTIKNVLSQKVLDVAWGVARNGTNVWQYNNNGTEAQKWIIKDCGDGYYNIISACDDFYLDVSNAKTSNGTNIQIYEGNGTNAQKFKFTKTDAIEPTKSIDSGIYKISISKNSNMVLDIAGASNNNGANVQIWSYENVLQQKFKVQYLNDGYYTIKCLKSNKVLDVANAVAKNGTNVWQYDSNGTEAQKWIIKACGDGYYNIVSACNDMFLDVAGGSTNSGANVQIYTGNNTDAQKFKFEKVTAVELETGTYGSSGLKRKGDARGQSLKYYKIGNGPNVFFATFAVHGWEDAFAYDGQELTKIAEAFKEKLISSQDESLASKWTIYLFPSVNPDGEYHGYTNNGPGRTTLYSAAPSNKGIDINRCWSVGYTKATSDRNYNGTAAFQAYEAQALRDFLLSHRATNGQTILVDLHGWLNETIGDDGIGSYYRSQLGMSKHLSTYGNGYLVNWARTNLGYNGRTARSCLVELPSVSNSSQVSSKGLANKYINATINMLRGII